MNDRPSDSRPEQPRSEPEILAPGENPRAGRPGEQTGVFIFFDRHGSEQRVQFVKPGRFAVFFTLLVVGLIAVAALIFALGFVLVAVPLLAAMIGALVLVFYLRNAIRRFWQR